MIVGFLGTGTIAAAMVHGIVEDNHHIWISQRNQAISAELCKKFSAVRVADNQIVIDRCDTIIICLLADTARVILPTLNFHSTQRILSVMVGMSVSELGTMVAPAVCEAIFIPYPSITQGNSPLLVYPKSDTLDALFGKRNEVIVVKDESALQSYLVAQAVLSPTVKILHETVLWLQKRVGQDVSAEKFIRLLIGGYLMAGPLDQSEVLAKALRDLGTEGGLNAQLRDHFYERGVYEILVDGLDELEKQLC